ncbi:tryptophan-associated transmembrane family protein [Mycobacterium xenopi 3993]|nr:tryptophan-associated transmembrane family protein [Mycobacterium xenopi 3993]
MADSNGPYEHTEATNKARAVLRAIAAAETLTAPTPAAMAKPERRKPTVLTAQLLLVIAAGGLWAAARLPWVVVRSFDGLGPPRTATISGATWSTALVPLAVLLLAIAIAALAVRGWPLRLLAMLVAVASLASGYLAIGLWALPDVAARGPTWRTSRYSRWWAASDATGVPRSRWWPRRAWWPVRCC